MGEFDDGVIDAQLMPYIDQASIACGGHAGSMASMRRTVAMAKAQQVMVGAHPSYPDRENFGRRSLHLTDAQIIDLLNHQVSRLHEVTSTLGVPLVYVKPHGALYNDMVNNDSVRKAVMQAVASMSPKLTLMMQATPDQQLHKAEAAALGLAVWFEAFADRRYEPSGLLRSRQSTNAVLDHSDMLKQAQQISREAMVECSNGSAISIQADTLCVHGDNPAALSAIKALRATLT